MTKLKVASQYLRMSLTVSDYVSSVSDTAVCCCIKASFLFGEGGGGRYSREPVKIHNMGSNAIRIFGLRILALRAIFEGRIKLVG